MAELKYEKMLHEIHLDYLEVQYKVSQFITKGSFFTNYVICSTKKETKLEIILINGSSEIKLVASISADPDLKSGASKILLVIIVIHDYLQ